MQVGIMLCTVMRPLLSTDDLSIYPPFCTWEVCYVRRSPLSNPKIAATSWKPIHLLKRENERRTNPQTEGFAWFSFKLATFRFHVNFCTSHDDHFKIPSLKTRFLSWPTWNIEKKIKRTLEFFLFLGDLELVDSNLNSTHEIFWKAKIIRKKHTYLQ